jgi:hypothetical protein
MWHIGHTSFYCGLKRSAGNFVNAGSLGDGSYVSSGNPVLKGGPFKGTIDDVMIFNGALTAGEVWQLFQSGS